MCACTCCSGMRCSSAKASADTKCGGREPVVRSRGCREETRRLSGIGCRESNCCTCHSSAWTCPRVAQRDVESQENSLERQHAEVISSVCQKRTSFFPREMRLSWEREKQEPGREGKKSDWEREKRHDDQPQRRSRWRKGQTQQRSCMRC